MVRYQTTTYVKRSQRSCRQDPACPCNCYHYHIFKQHNPTSQKKSILEETTQVGPAPVLVSPAPVWPAINSSSVKTPPLPPIAVKRTGSPSTSMGTQQLQQTEPTAAPQSQPAQQKQQPKQNSKQQQPKQNPKQPPQKNQPKKYQQKQANQKLEKTDSKQAEHDTKPVETTTDLPTPTGPSYADITRASAATTTATTTPTVTNTTSTSD